jgi:hypothetical protein
VTGLEPRRRKPIPSHAAADEDVLTTDVTASRRSVLRSGAAIGVGVTSFALPTAARAASDPGSQEEAETFRRFDAVALSTATAGVGAASVDSLFGPGGVGPDGTHGYLAGVQSGSACVVKFRLSDLAIIGVLPVTGQTDTRGMVVVGSYAYLVTTSNGWNQYVQKVRLDAPSGTGVVAGMLHLGGSGLVTDKMLGYGIIVADADHVVTSDWDNPTSKVYKTRIHAGTDTLPEYLGSVTIHPDNGSRALRSVAGIASDGTHLYATDETGPFENTGEVPSKISKIALSGNATPGTGGMEVVGELVLAEGEGYPYALVANGGHVYVASWTSPTEGRGSVVKVATSGGTQPGSGGLERLGAITLGDGEASPSSLVLAGTHLYVGTFSDPARVVKVAANLSSATLPARVDGLTMLSGERRLLSGFRSGQYLYFVGQNSPGRIVRCIDPAL